jgi:hypothetical protein
MCVLAIVNLTGTGTYTVANSVSDPYSFDPDLIRI